MDVSATKLKIIEWVLNLEDEEQLNELKTLSEECDDFWDKLPETAKKLIEASQQEYKDGKTIPHAEVMKKMKLRFGF